MSGVMPLHERETVKVKERMLAERIPPSESAAKSVTLFQRASQLRLVRVTNMTSLPRFLIDVRQPRRLAIRVTPILREICDVSI